MLTNAQRWLRLIREEYPPYATYGDCPRCGKYITIFLMHHSEVHPTPGRDVFRHDCRGTLRIEAAMRVPAGMVLRQVVEIHMRIR